VNILSLARDITERKLLEEALKKSEESFRHLFENSTVGLYRTTLNGKILLANPTLVNMLGFESFEQLAKRNLEMDGFKPGYQRSEFKRMVENDTFIRGLDIVWKKKDGSEIYVQESAKAIRDTDGRILYYEGTVEDITEQKKVEAARQSSEFRYRRLFEAAKDGILILDAASGRVVDVNPFLVQLLEVTYENICGKELWELGFFKDIAANKANFLELQKKRYIRYKNLPLETASGKKINVEFISNVYQVNNQKVIQCNVRDISARTKFEEKLRQNAEELRDRNKDLERFNKAAVGRELRMIELKKQINELSQKLGQTTPYPSLDSDSFQPNKKNI
jgi:PAS domain S-box-containing protein